MEYLEKDVKLEDFSESFRPFVEIIGVPAALKVCRVSGGVLQYIPLYEQCIREARNRAIAREFNGSNYRQLALKFGVVETTVRNITEAARKENQKKYLEKNQTELF